MENFMLLFIEIFDFGNIGVYNDNIFSLSVRPRTGNKEKQPHSELSTNFSTGGSQKWKKSGYQFLQETSVLHGLDINLHFSVVCKRDRFWVFSNKTYKRNPVCQENIVFFHWSLFVIAMPNWPPFQSWFPRYRSKVSENFQMTNKPRSWSLFRQN